MKLRSLSGWVISLALLGCAEPEDHPEPDVDVVAPYLEPPPPSSKKLSRERVVEIVQKADDPADAVAVLDSRPFAFALDAPALQWFGQQGVSPQVMDYLQKRSKIDWDALRGDVDPSGPR